MRWEVRGLRNSLKIAWRWPEDWSQLTGTCPSMMTYIRGPQSSDCRQVPVHGLLRTGPHSGRWAVGEQVKSPSLTLRPEPSHPPPPPLCQNFFFHETCPWCQKDWGPLPYMVSVYMCVCISWPSISHKIQSSCFETGKIRSDSTGLLPPQIARMEWWMLKLEEGVRPQDCMVPPSLWPGSCWSFICLVPPAFEFVILGIYSILGRLRPLRESLPPQPARAACHYSHWSSSCWDWRIDTCLLLLVTSSRFKLWHEYVSLVRLRSHAHASAAKAAGKRHLGICNFLDGRWTLLPARLIKCLEAKQPNEWQKSTRRGLAV